MWLCSSWKGLMTVSFSSTGDIACGALPVVAVSRSAPTSAGRDSIDFEVGSQPPPRHSAAQPWLLPRADARPGAEDVLSVGGPTHTGLRWPTVFAELRTCMKRGWRPIAVIVVASVLMLSPDLAVSAGPAASPSSAETVRLQQAKLREEIRELRLQNG